MNDDWSAMDPEGLLVNAVTPAELPQVLILTPVKNAATWLEGYFERILALTYPHELLSLGMLESDSRDQTFNLAGEHIRRVAPHLRRARLWNRTLVFISPGVRLDMPVQFSENGGPHWPEVAITSSSCTR
ncbi:MAG: hypothetical protein R2839_12065 [Thermomicrobiales bacterium]